MLPKRNTQFDSVSTPPRFAFFDNGEFAGDHEKADMELSYFVGRLCRMRKDKDASPSELATILGASEHAHSFNPETLAYWLTLTDHFHWPFADCTRSVEQAVKDGGMGVGGCDRLHVLRHPTTDFERDEARGRFDELVKQIAAAWRF